MQVKEEKNSDKNYSGLILLLVISGLTDSMAKIFEELGDRNLDSWFLLITFIVAFFLSVGMMIYHKEKLRVSEIVYGCLVGIPNYGSVFFDEKSSTDFLIIFSNLRKCWKGLLYQAFPAFCVSEDTPHIMAYRSLIWRSKVVKA